MGGITRIQNSREESQRAGSGDGPPNKEIWLKDGDQVFLTSVATGDENDNLLDELYLYTFRLGTRWTNVLKDERVDMSDVPSDARPSHKFAFWTYVHNVIHAEKRVDSWEEVEGPGGKKSFRENVNDFRIVSLGFGRNDTLWNQLVDIYSDWGALNKGVIRIRRTGSGLYDTAYALTATPKKEEIPDERMAEVKELPMIREYFFSRYGETTPSTGDASVPASSTENDSLF
tara:strand:- start:3995 stop:4684 length:690 start_codon:yes stop_codon:yes gene_type:complete